MTTIKKFDDSIDVLPLHIPIRQRIVESVPVNIILNMKFFHMFYSNLERKYPSLDYVFDIIGDKAGVIQRMSSYLIKKSTFTRLYRIWIRYNKYLEYTKKLNIKLEHFIRFLDIFVENHFQYTPTT